jgi:hypothetical protein
MLRLRKNAHAPGLWHHLWRLWRGQVQLLVRPASELPLVTIAHVRGDAHGAEHFQAALQETWLTLPEELRRTYGPILQRTPPMVLVDLRRRNVCGCLGHFHPRGSEGRAARRWRAISGVEVAELDLAWEAIRDWRPAPLAQTAAWESAGEGAAEELALFRFHVALLGVFLHELHHYACPGASEAEVRGLSTRFYEQALSALLKDRYGVEYGLNRH